MSILCRLGIHQIFGDTVGTNVGTEATPVFILTTYETCDRCGWTTRPNGGGNRA